MRQEARPLYSTLVFWREVTLDKALPCSRGQFPVRNTAVSQQQPLFSASRGDPDLLIVSSNAQNLFFIEIVHRVKYTHLKYIAL